MSTNGKNKNYLNQGEAASYCGYCRNTFRSYAEEYAIPAYGPKKNRFKANDLDAFMADPEAFYDPFDDQGYGLEKVTL